MATLTRGCGPEQADSAQGDRPDRGAAGVIDAPRSERHDALSYGFRVIAVLLALAAPAPAKNGESAERDVHALFAAAEAAGRVGTARKTKPVDARPARPGEIIVTLIKGEGRETRASPPPMAIGWSATGARSPATKSICQGRDLRGAIPGPAFAAGSHGWREFRPQGPEMRFFVVGDGEGAFTFAAPWGEPMAARPGDAIIAILPIPKTPIASPPLPSSARIRS